MKPIIETERLFLCRPDGARDYEGWAAMMADAETVRFLGGVTLNRGQSWRTLATMIGHWEMRGYGMFSMIEKESGKFVGRTGPWFPEGWDGPEIGWGVTRENWGQGYATEAARASLDYAFTTLGWTEAIHYIDLDNHASRNVAEKLGSKPIRKVDIIGGVFEGPAWIYGQPRP